MAWLAGAWLAFAAAFVAGHLRVRFSGPKAREVRVRVDSLSDWGLVLQALGVAAALLTPVRPREQMLAASMVLAGLSTVLAGASLFHLGRQWRVRAVIASDHELITSGPYGLVRHPVYLALLGMVVATLLLTGSWATAVLALGLYLVGTEIRVRSEDRLLAGAFPGRFGEYQRTVRAYLPWVR